MTVWLYGIYKHIEELGDEIAVYFKNGDSIPEIPGYELLKVKLHEKAAGILENRDPITGFKLGDKAAKGLSEFHQQL